ncbi:MULTISPECIES: hypothetical protein [unclassified Streptosporangium]|uniref:hypothetical protein n=1 Tax=Streptosporangium sp. NPDC005286 TaxID=3154463 RepID=UPI0033ADBB70
MSWTKHSTPEFQAIADTLTILERLTVTSDLPDQPDMKRVNQWMVEAYAKCWMQEWLKP